jgi:hypothetical protein
LHKTNLNQIRFKDYVKLKETSNLLVSKKEQKYMKSLDKMSLIPFEEGVLTTDNFFILQNGTTKGFLVIDTDDKNSNYDWACAVTTNPLISFACPRSLFSIKLYDEKTMKNSNNLNFTSINQDKKQIINYGQKILILSHPINYPEKNLILFSSLLSPQSYSRFSRNQEVLINTEISYNSCWCIEHIDPTLRFSLEGKPVSTKEPFVIRHCSTNRLLASDLIDYYNDYGNEYEVCCNNFLTNNKFQALISEKEGRMKIDTKTKLEKEQNIWFVVDQF